MTLYQFTVDPVDPEDPQMYAHVHAPTRSAARGHLFDWLEGMRAATDWRGWCAIYDGSPLDRLELTITRTGAQWFAGRSVWAVFGLGEAWAVAVREAADA